MPTFPLLSLVIINALPVLGVLLFEWNLYTLLLLYWSENAFIGLITIAKMLTAAQKGELGKSRSYQVIFFVTHYSTFWVLHAVVLVTVFQMSGAESEGAAWLYYAMLPLYVVQHVVSYRVHWVGRSEFERMSATKTMVLPYVRVLGVLLLTIVGGIAVWQLGQPPAALAALAVLKIVIDAASHTFIHRALGGTQPSLAQ